MPKHTAPKQRKIRVTFSKVVKVNTGAQKKLKRVNATRLAYDILSSESINKPLMQQLVRKHRQHGSTKKAVQESIETLSELGNRLCDSKYDITTIGSRFVLNNDLSATMDWSDKLNKALHALKKSSNP